MLIFWDQRLVFLATPKAGSTAIEAALEPIAAVDMKRPVPLKHMSAQDFETHLQPYLQQQAGERFTTVALMREPESWLASWYRFRLQEAEPAPGIRPPSFDTFARGYIANPQTGGIGTQSGLLCNAEGRPLVDRIFRYEKIEDLVAFLEDRLDFAITLPRVNVPRAASGAVLGKETKARLKEALATDFRLYDSLS